MECRAELCPYWPGEGCLRGVMPCDDVELARRAGVIYNTPVAGPLAPADVPVYTKADLDKAVADERESICHLAVERKAYYPVDPARPYDSPRAPFADLIGGET